jgi:acyl dehydratase
MRSQHRHAISDARVARFSATQQNVDRLPSPIGLYGRALATLAKTSTGAPLPKTTLVRPAVALDAAHIARYAAVCGFQPHHGVPITYLHMLAFPLQMMLMSERAFPYPMMGLVHLANTVRQVCPLVAGQVVRVEVRASRLFRHDKGQAFSLDTAVLRHDTLVWRGESLYLRLGVSEPQGLPYDTRMDHFPALAKREAWDLKGDLGRRYGKVSGDLNPIHLSALSAKLFGFRRAIAHGMWTKARALATLIPPQPVGQAEASVEFKTPLFLPGAATLWQGRNNETLPDKTGFEVRDGAGEKPHLRGWLQL